MKCDVWVFVLQPGDVDYSEFCFNAGLVVTGWEQIDGYKSVFN
jgi:hypothetical protein